MNTFRSISRVLAMTAVLAISNANAISWGFINTDDFSLNKHTQVKLQVVTPGALAVGFNAVGCKFMTNTCVATQLFGLKGKTDNTATIKFGVANGVVRAIVDLGSEKLITELNKSEKVQAIRSFANDVADKMYINEIAGINFPGKTTIKNAVKYVSKEAAIAAFAHYGLNCLSVCGEKCIGNKSSVTTKTLTSNSNPLTNSGSNS
jgi:hypothetical protein